MTAYLLTGVEGCGVNLWTVMWPSWMTPTELRYLLDVCKRGHKLWLSDAEVAR
jgi:hypothetical protein